VVKSFISGLLSAFIILTYKVTFKDGAIVIGFPKLFEQEATLTYYLQNTSLRSRDLNNLITFQKG
jgi:hypothetical protein